MGDLLFLDRADVQRFLDMDALLAALEDALQDLSAGRTSAPPRVAAATPHGLLVAMPGYLPGTPLMAKLVSVFPSNTERGLPSHQGLIALFDEQSGEPLAVIDGAYITEVRTGATSAVAARSLARRQSRSLAILGAGAQGRSHLDAFTHVFELDDIAIASRSMDNAVALASRDPRARAVGSFEEAVRGADIVCCCTNAPEPVIRLAWLAAGVHVSSVGIGLELDLETVASTSLFVEWRGAVERPPPAGAAELQGLNPAAVTEVGEVLARTRPGRRSDEEITVYKSTGHAVEDAAAAGLVFDLAKKDAGLG